MNIKTVLEILEHFNVPFSFKGKKETEIIGYCPIDQLENNCMTWIRRAEHYDFTQLADTRGVLVICNRIEINHGSSANFLFVEKPHAVYFSLLARIFEPQGLYPGISDTAVVKTQKLGTGVSIGDFSYIGEEVVIGNNVDIKNNVSITGPVSIGDHTTIWSGAVIGGDGYGYYRDIDGQEKRVPHLGGVTIGKNVEIGSNTCIARGCLGDTIIHDDVKIDNLCHIAHNVVIGKRSKIIALAILGGSCLIGEDVWVAPAAAIKNQVEVGDGSLVGLGAVVVKNVDQQEVVAGVPAKPMKKKDNS